MLRNLGPPGGQNDDARPMPGDREPPGERGGGPTPETARHHQLPARIKDQHPHSRRGCDWRAGFAAGFRDALRLAARRGGDLDTLALLLRLADDYDLAGEP